MRAIARKRGQGKYRCMAKDTISLGEVAAHGATMLEIRCGRCDRHGRLSVKRLLARYGPDTAMGEVMREQIGDCPHKNDTQLYTRCDPFCPTLAQLFSPYADEIS